MSTYSLPTPAELAFNSTLASVPLHTSLDNPHLSKDLEMQKGVSSSPPILHAQSCQFLWDRECVRETLPLDFSLALRNRKIKTGFDFSRPRCVLGLKAELCPFREPNPDSPPKPAITSHVSTRRLSSSRRVKSTCSNSQQSQTNLQRIASAHPPSRNRRVTRARIPITSSKFRQSRSLTSTMSVRSLRTGQNIYHSSLHTSTGMRTCSISSTAKKVHTLHARSFNNTRSESIGLWRGIQQYKSSHGEVSDADLRRFSSKKLPRSVIMLRVALHSIFCHVEIVV